MKSINTSDECEFVCARKYIFEEKFDHVQGAVESEAVYLGIDVNQFIKVKTNN